MAEYALSNKAENDLLRIARQSLAQWGRAQARRYIRGLHDQFMRLAEFPDLGRDASGIRSGCLRIESGSHVILYRKTTGGIRIVRVLHERMNLPRHL
ncbi:type II toxin-antitoxin system RelE/ParE family toxin [Azospirillum sp. B4]|uniref:type II toxin-antitoxin system RelE/ParE family toxin n=1 Tax=Azospirillum sp. B4 TaxID=95605 RepID=UPI000A02A321